MHKSGTFENALCSWESIPLPVFLNFQESGFVGSDLRLCSQDLLESGVGLDDTEIADFDLDVLPLPVDLLTNRGGEGLFDDGLEIVSRAIVGFQIGRAHV